MPRIKFECCHADTCLPCFWSGHHLPHVQIPVERGMTLAVVKELIKDELHLGAVMGSTVEAYAMQDCPQDVDQAYVNKVYRAAVAAVNRMKLARPGRLFMDLDERPDDYDGEVVYAFFVFRDLED